MSIPSEVYSGVSKLKPRRRVNSAGNPMEEFVPEMEGIGLNQPIETGDGGFSPESYDVRANQIIDPQAEAQEQEDNDLYRLGMNLQKAIQAQEQGQDPLPTPEGASPMGQMGIPQPVSPPQQAPEAPPPPPPEQSRGVLGTLYDYTLQPFVDWVNPEKRKEIQKGIQERNLAKEQGITVEEMRQRDAQAQGDIKGKINEAIQQPFENVVWGATDMVANSPEAISQLDKVGIPVTPEELELTKKMEAALSDLSEAELKAQGVWDEQIGRFRDRIDSGMATDQDKFLVGLALLMPLVLGLALGPEAGLGALGGTMKGFAESLGKREKTLREDESALTELEKLKQTSQLKTKELELEGLKIPAAVKKAVGEHPYEHFKNMKGQYETNPETGEKELTKVELLPGLEAFVDYMPDKASITEMRKKGHEINSERSAIEKMSNSVRRIAQISTQMKEKGTWKQFWDNYVLDKKPELLSKFGHEVTVDGKKVNSAVMLAKEIQEMVDNRRLSMKIRGFGQNVVKHAEELFTSPIGRFNSPNDLLDQVTTLYTDTRNLLLNNAGREGFDANVLANDFRGQDKALWNYLNKKENIKRGSELEQRLAEEEE